MWQIITSSTPQLVKAGIKFTIPIAIISFAIALVLAMITALVRLSNKKGFFLIVKAIFSFYVWLFRSTPMLVQLFIVYFGLPYMDIKGICPNGIKLSAPTAAVITFSLNSGAYASETIRGAILSIPRGQWEAAYSLGMTKSQVLRRIIFPQALRISLPPLSNSFISLVKGTSLAASISVVETFEVSQQIAAQNYQPMIMYSLTAVLYAIVCSLLTWLQHYLEKVSSRYVTKN